MTQEAQMPHIKESRVRKQVCFLGDIITHGSRPASLAQIIFIIISETKPSLDHETVI